MASTGITTEVFSPVSNVKRTNERKEKPVYFVHFTRLWMNLVTSKKLLVEQFTHRTVFAPRVLQEPSVFLLLGIVIDAIHAGRRKGGKIAYGEKE